MTTPLPDAPRPFAPMPILRPHPTRLHKPAQVITSPDGDSLELTPALVGGGEGRPDYNPAPTPQPGWLLMFFLAIGALLAGCLAMLDRDEV